LRAALTGNAVAMAGEPFDATPFLPEPGAGLDALREAARRCRGCDLWRPATQTVFGEGPADATFVLVGEVPGDREDRAGHPFIGPAGRELDKALEAAGIDRAETYVTNAVKHFRFQERGKRRIHQKPDAKQLKACRPWLLAELDRVRPEVLVLLGATAAKSLLGSRFRLMAERGRPLDSDLAPVVVATIHPSSILRERDSAARQAQRDLLWEDLRAAAQALDRVR
jgi:DNA polymerase